MKSLEGWCGAIFPVSRHSKGFYKFPSFSITLFPNGDSTPHTWRRRCKLSVCFCFVSLCFLFYNPHAVLYRNLIGTQLWKKSMVLSKQQPFPIDHLLPILHLLLIQIIKLRKPINTLLLLLDNRPLISLSKIPPRTPRNQVGNRKIQMGLENRTKVTLNLMALLMLRLIRRLQKLGFSQVLFHCFFYFKLSVQKLKMWAFMIFLLNVSWILHLNWCTCPNNIKLWLKLRMFVPDANMYPSQGKPRICWAKTTQHTLNIVCWSLSLLEARRVESFLPLCSKRDWDDVVDAPFKLRRKII